MNTHITAQTAQHHHAVMRSVDDLHRSKKGKVSNKWSSYLAYYDQLFAPLRDAPLRLLEIGIQNGGSLETWASYFSRAESIIGCDINEKCHDLVYTDPRISVIVGNANTSDIFRTIVGRGPYDVVIDDGSHLSEDILVSFLNYFPTVKPGGIYVVEDTHAVYQRASTNIHHKLNALAFFKDLTDVINYQFWFRDEKIENLLKPYLNVAIPSFLAEGWIDSIEFRNSIVTIRKSTAPDHNKLGTITIGGDVAEIDTEPLRIKQAMLMRSRVAQDA
jgi:cephalosporin hydroxylase